MTETEDKNRDKQIRHSLLMDVASDSSTQSQVILLNYKKCFCHNLTISFFNEMKHFKPVFHALMGCSNLFFSIEISIKENSRGKRYMLVFSVIFVVTR